MSLYNILYDALNITIFDGTAISYQQVFLSLICMIAVLFVLALPFIVVFKVVKMICG